LLYLTLFFTALLAATLLPGGSEALLLYDLSLHAQIPLLFIAATLGNTFGALVNYLLGRKGADFLVRRRYANAAVLKRADRIFDRYGAWALLFSWMPVVGDPVTLVAGVLKYDLKNFLGLVLIAKGMRYGVVIALYLQFL